MVKESIRPLEQHHGALRKRVELLVEKVLIRAVGLRLGAHTNAIDPTRIERGQPFGGLRLSEDHSVGSSAQVVELY
jgi:hypothetical protein